MVMASDKNTEETGKRKVLDWIGYKKDEVLSAPMTPEEMLSKIQKQQEEIAALRAQKDFHELDSQELEALASETAVTILATVHKREADAKKAAGAAIAAAEKKSEQIIAKAEGAAAELHLAAEKKLKEADKQSAQTIAAAEATASATLKNATAEAKSIVSGAESEAAKAVRDANALAETTRRESESYATKTRRDADTYAAKTTKDANDIATTIRKEIADSLAIARANHIAAADTQEKARQAAEKAYNTIIASIEDFDNHAKKIQQDLKPATEK
ncbi:MAG: hypothetical protein RLZZ330_36 [Actinomycetota bacterium]|jgi:colicin import membrane protein